MTEHHARGFIVYISRTLDLGQIAQFVTRKMLLFGLFGVAGGIAIASGASGGRVHDAAAGGRSDGGGPSPEFGIAEFGEDRLHDGETSIDDAEQGFEAGEESDQGVDTLGVLSMNLSCYADADQGYDADTGARFLLVRCSSHWDEKVGDCWWG